MFGTRRVVCVLALVLVVGALAACQGLAQALGANPAATAPAYNGIGLIAQPGAEVKVYGSPNQSGPVGASGSASAQADMAQTTEIGAEAIDALLSAAQDAIAGGNPAAAQGILGAAQKIGGARKGRSVGVKSPAGNEAPFGPPTAPVRNAESKPDTPIPPPLDGAKSGG